MSETSTLERESATRKRYVDGREYTLDGIYTHGREADEHVQDRVFFGLINAEAFYENVNWGVTHPKEAAKKACDTTRRVVVDYAAKPIAGAFTKVRGLLGRNWYLSMGLVAGLALYGALTVAQPKDVVITNDPSFKPRKRTPMDIWKGYFLQGKKKLESITSDSDSLENKVEPK